MFKVLLIFIFNWWHTRSWPKCAVEEKQMILIYFSPSIHHVHASFKNHFENPQRFFKQSNLMRIFVLISWFFLFILRGWRNVNWIFFNDIQVAINLFGSTQCNHIEMKAAKNLRRVRVKNLHSRDLKIISLNSNHFLFIATWHERTHTLYQQCLIMKSRVEMGVGEGKC